MRHRFNQQAERHDIYTRVTNKIVAALEQGVRPWSQPWNAGNTEGRIIRPLRHNGEAYSGINVLMLWSSAMEGGYSSPFWMTFKQCETMGAHVRKGEHGSPVVYADKITRTEHLETGEDVERQIPFLKSYTVFNADQIEGLPEKFYNRPPPRLDTIERIDQAESFFAATNADIRTGGNMAAYVIGADHIRMPPIEAFRDSESYYATLCHEFTHWTRHPTRLDRDLGRKKFGDEGYAMEELVAELGAAFLCADLDIVPEVRDENAAYIANWLTVLKNDNRAIFTAASHAQRASDFLHRLQPADLAPPSNTPPPAEPPARKSSQFLRAPRP